MKASFVEALTKRATEYGFNDEQHEHLNWEMKQDGFPKTKEELRATVSRMPWPFPLATHLLFFMPDQSIMHRLPYLNTYSTPLVVCADLGSPCHVCCCSSLPNSAKVAGTSFTTEWPATTAS